MKAKSLNIIEIFASVQGETSLSGLPTTFIRLAACNLRCTWCDTTYSFGRGVSKSLEDIMSAVDANGCHFVCITGGEPLLQDHVHPLMTTLCDAGYSLSLETGGSLPTHQVDPRVKIILDVKCPGSGMEGKNRWENLSELRPHDEVKFVIADRVDYDYAKEVAQHYSLLNNKHTTLFSPVHGKLSPQHLVEWILEDKLPVRINLQIHKVIWTPETRGV
jgi:7-carboxy-7-deazaguanine synthase